MQQLRQRVIASCHIGPLSTEDTRGYVEHRLRGAMRNNDPAFADGAFDAIYRYASGIPPEDQYALRSFAPFRLSERVAPDNRRSCRERREGTDGRNVLGQQPFQSFTSRFVPAGVPIAVGLSAPGIMPLQSFRTRPSQFASADIALQNFQAEAILERLAQIEQVFRDSCRLYFRDFVVPNERPLSDSEPPAPDQERGDQSDS